MCWRRACCIGDVFANLYNGDGVTAPVTATMTRWDSAGAIDWTTTVGLDLSGAIAANPLTKRVYFAATHGIRALDATSGDSLWLVNPGATPSDVAVTGDGSIYSTLQTGSGYSLVKLAAADGAIQWIAPLPGFNRSNPCPIVAGPDGNLYITEVFNSGAGTSRIHRYGPDGDGGVFITPSPAAGIREIAVAKDGSIYTAEAFSPFARKYSSGGAAVGGWSSGVTDAVVAIAVDGAGRVFLGVAPLSVSPSHPNRVELHAASGGSQIWRVDLDVNHAPVDVAADKSTFAFLTMTDKAGLFRMKSDGTYAWAVDDRVHHSYLTARRVEMAAGRMAVFG